MDYAIKREPINVPHPQLEHEAKMYEILKGGGNYLSTIYRCVMDLDDFEGPCGGPVLDALLLSLC